MILLDQRDVQFRARRLCPERQVAGSAGAIDAAPEDENVKRLGLKPLNRQASSVGIDGGRHFYILVDRPGNTGADRSRRSRFY